MNKPIFLIFISLFIYSCIGTHQSDAQRAYTGVENTIQKVLKADTLSVDLSNSSIHWKGTKMRGAGKHEGELQLQSSYFLSEKGKISGGQFIADMTSIGVTDIPLHELIPIRNLNNHLKSEDFFEVENYPTSKFVISIIEHLPNDSISVSGNLTIKNITRLIEFKAINREQEFSTKFKFDRFLWNIAYEGSWADKTLVDRDIELTIKLKIKQ